MKQGFSLLSQKDSDGMFLIVFCLLIYNIAVSQEPPFSSSSRTVALGGTSVAASNIEGIVDLNPASLALNREHYLFLDGRIQDYSYENTVIKVPWNHSDMSLSLSLIDEKLGFSVLYRRKGNEKYVFSNTDEYGGELENGSPVEDSKHLFYEYYFSFSYGRPVTERIQAGMSLGLLYSDTDNYLYRANYLHRNRFAGALDIGVLLTLSRKVTLGLKVENFIKSAWRHVTFDYGGHILLLDQLPTRLHLGGSLQASNKTTVNLDVRDIYTSKVGELEPKPSLNFGVEHYFLNLLVARIGYMYSRIPKDFSVQTETRKFVYKSTSFFSFGIGLDYRRFNFDTAILLNDRRQEILSTDVSVGNLTVSGSTFYYMVSAGYSL